MLRTLAVALCLTACTANLSGPDDRDSSPVDLGVTEGLPPIVDDSGKRIDLPKLPPPVNTCAGAPPTQQTFVMGTKVMTIPSVSPPGKCQGIRDPVFNTLVARVTDISGDGIGDGGLENEYSRNDPENADGTRLLLRGLEGTWYLYDAATFKMLRKIDVGSGPQEPDPRWDSTDPKTLYFLEGSRLMKTNVETNQSSVVHDFAGQLSGSQPVITGKSEGDASRDQRYWCWIVADADTSSWTKSAVITYDRVTNTITGKLASLKYDIDWVSMSMSGGHCVIGWSDQTAEVYPRNMSGGTTLPDGASGHMDLGLTAEGKDVIVYQNNSTDWIAMTYLDTGQEVNLVQIPFNVNKAIGLHMSGNNYKRPGWHLISTYGPRTPDGSHSWMDNHLFMVELKASPRIWRIATTYSYTCNSSSDDSEYFAEAFAAINAAGNRVYWGSNWGSSSLRKIETFVAILPPNWHTQLP